MLRAAALVRTSFMAAPRVGGCWAKVSAWRCLLGRGVRKGSRAAGSSGSVLVVPAVRTGWKTADRLGARDGRAWKVVFDMRINAELFWYGQYQFIASGYPVFPVLPVKRRWPVTVPPPGRQAFACGSGRIAAS